MAKSREFKNQHVDKLATVDPVKIGRDDRGGVPSNVLVYWNRYETKTADGGVVIPVVNIHPHGYNPASNAVTNNVAPDLNPDGTATETDQFIYPPDYKQGKTYFIDHFNIIGVVEPDLVKVLTD